MADQVKKIVGVHNGSLSPGARRGYLVLRWVGQVFAVLIAVQVFLAGMATFVDSASWMAHTNLSQVFILFPITLILTSFIARLPAAFRVRSIVLLVTVVLMYPTAVYSSYIGILAALHPVIALVMFRNAMNLARQASAQIKSSSPSMAA